MVARLTDGSPIGGTEMINILGNHESTMLEALAGEKASATDWLFAGGKATLESYGIDPEAPRGSNGPSASRSAIAVSCAACR